MDHANGLIHLSSSRSVDETVQRLQQLLAEKRVTLFATVDHSGEAAKVGLNMRPMKLVIFGNPQAGTLLMQASPTVGIDLPLKALIWEDSEGKVCLTYNDPGYVQQRHRFPEELIGRLAVATPLLAKAVE